METPSPVQMSKEGEWGEGGGSKRKRVPLPLSFAIQIFCYSNQFWKSITMHGNKSNSNITNIYL